MACRASPLSLCPPTTMMVTRSIARLRRAVPWPTQLWWPVSPLLATSTRQLRLAATPRLAPRQRPGQEALVPDTAVGALDKTSDWLSPEDYSTLEVMPLDESGLPKLEQQQRAQKERQVTKKQARSAMLEDVKQTVGKLLSSQAAAPCLHRPRFHFSSGRSASCWLAI